MSLLTSSFWFQNIERWANCADILETAWNSTVTFVRRNDDSSCYLSMRLNFHSDWLFVDSWHRLSCSHSDFATAVSWPWPSLTEVDLPKLVDIRCSYSATWTLVIFKSRHHVLFHDWIIILFKNTRRVSKHLSTCEDRLFTEKQFLGQSMDFLPPALNKVSNRGAKTQRLHL